MTELELLSFPDRETFHNWLAKNHDKSPGIWMVYFKKHTDSLCITYQEALDEALCFGWIDSIIKRLDNDRYLRKFTPRQDISNWSEVNKRKVDQLIKTGRMQEAGLRKIDVYLRTGKVAWDDKTTQAKPEANPAIAEALLQELARNEPALTNFHNLSAGNRRLYLLWIASAKREETVLKRISEAAVRLKENRTLGLK